MENIAVTISDYENIIGTSVFVHLSNDDYIQFKFKENQLPHLLGLQHLVDVPILNKYQDKKVSAVKVINALKSPDRNLIDDIENSKYYKDLFESRIQYFSSENILDIIKTGNIVKFSNRKTQGFISALEKTDYFFWKEYCFETDRKYLHLILGFVPSHSNNTEDFPNSFFAEKDMRYIDRQISVRAVSTRIKQKNHVEYFNVNENVLFNIMTDNSHYKYLKDNNALPISLLNKSNSASSIEEMHIHYFAIDALTKIYGAYFPHNYKWSNAEKIEIFNAITDNHAFITPKKAFSKIEKTRKKKT